MMSKLSALAFLVLGACGVRKLEKPHGHHGQRWSLPKNAETLYGFAPDRSTVAKIAPECNVPEWGDIDLSSSDAEMWGYKYIGAKVPDSCCSNEELFKYAVPEPLEDSNGVQHTCYIHPAGGLPGFRPSDRMRLYLGCVDGQLVGAENCVPQGVHYLTEEEFIDNTYTYPMNATFGDEQWMNGTPDDCGCSKTSRFNHGPGCYLAFANAYDSGNKFKGAAASSDPPPGPAPDTGVRGGVYVRITGEC